MDIGEMLCKSHNWAQVAGDGVQWGGGAFVNTGSTRGETVLSSGEPAFQVCILERIELVWRLTD
jgi:hypothetical protein